MPRSWIPPRVDVIIGVTAFGVACLSALLYAAAGIGMSAEWWVSLLCLMLTHLPLIWRCRVPLVVVALVALGFFLGQLLTVPELLIGNISLFLALYTAGAHPRDRRRSAVVRGVVVGGMFVWLFVAFALQGSATNSLFADVPHTGPIAPLVAFALIQVLTNVLYFGAAVFFGNRAWAASEQRRELAARTTELAAEREVTARQAVTLERLRIARELHDVVAHHVSVMGVQAGAARRTLVKDPEAASGALTAIESSAREAVDELHRMLGTLRAGETTATPDAAAESPSTRGLDQLPALVESAGLPARYQVVGDPTPVPATVGFTLYRVAQEALTNTRKHGGPDATADVRLRYLATAVELEITDTGSGGRVRGDGARLGQQGMTERMRAVGGAVEFGPRERGGYRVRASAPVRGAAG